MTSAIASFLAETCSLLKRLDHQHLAQAAELLIAAHRQGRRFWTMGNGGSASTAQHFACDLAKWAIPEGQRACDVRCLTDNIALYTAWANDAPREEVFVNLLRGLTTPGDVLIAVSVHGGSGFSADLVRAVAYAKSHGVRTLALVGFDGGPLRAMADVAILVPVSSTPQTEAIHLVIEHLLMSLIRDDLAARPL